MITFHTKLTLTNHYQGLEARIKKSRRAEKRPFRLTRYRWEEWQHDKTSHWSPVCCEAFFVTEEAAIKAAEIFVSDKP
jgi:hypothetical protein